MKTQEIAQAQVEEVTVVNSLEALEALAAKTPKGKTKVVKVKDAKATEEVKATDGGPVYNQSKPTKFDIANMRPARNKAELAKVCFPVAIQPVHQVIPIVNIDGQEISLADNGTLVNFMPDAKSVVTRLDEGNRKIISFVGNTYNLVTNQTIIDEIKPLVDQVIGEKGYKVLVQNWKDRRFQIEFVIEQDPTALALDDLVYTSLKIYNSYDGGQRYSMSLGGMRKVCTNGMIAFESTVNQVSRHTVNLKTAAFALEKALEENKAVADKYRKLVERPVTPAELDEIMAFMKDTKDAKFLFPKKKIDHSVGVAKAEAETLYGGELNAWLLYNGFNNTINHNLDWEFRYLQKTDEQVLSMLTDKLNISLS